MDDTAGFDEVPLGDRPSPAASGFDDRTATGPEGRDAAQTLDPADPTPATIAGEILSAGPTSGLPLASGTTTAAAGASLAGAHRAAPAIAGYEILGELGRGGMGVVYRARQVRLNRPCALKMILAGAHATPEAATRFLAEAEAIARLEHPHIVRIHHIGESDGLPFFELEFAPGGSLDGQLDGTPWPPARAARIAAQLASAIAQAHRQGIVHRDLKPGNVLMAADGTPKIADFGLAKAVGSESGLTATEAILGSPSYMAPEQAGGKAKEAGPAADIYAVGAILYELLTGRPPFRGATVLETLEQVKTVEPVPPSQLVPRLPKDIETICLKCLQKDPGRRYESAAGLAEDLRRFEAGEPIYETAKTSLEATARWLDRLNPDAAASLREGLEETLTVVRLGVPGALRRTLATTNPIESALSVTRRVTARVTRWRDGDMRRRWCVAGLLRAESKFRRVKGHRAMTALLKVLEGSARSRPTGTGRGVS